MGLLITILKKNLKNFVVFPLGKFFYHIGSFFEILEKSDLKFFIIHIDSNRTRASLDCFDSLVVRSSNLISRMRHVISQYLG